MATGNGLKLLQRIFSSATQLSEAKTLPLRAWRAATATDASPSAEYVQLHHLAELVSRLRPEDFGWNNRRFPKSVTYEHVCGRQDSPFHLGIFLIPKHHRIPLHDHPGMLVISKLLVGTLHVKSYSKGPPGTAMRREGLLSGDKFAALITYPEEGNLHEFTALESCAIFDVLLPPYNPQDGRHCQYYVESREVSPKNQASTTTTPFYTFSPSPSTSPAASPSSPSSPSPSSSSASPSPSSPSSDAGLSEVVFSEAVATRIREVDEPENFYVEHGGSYNFPLGETPN